MRTEDEAIKFSGQFEKKRKVLASLKAEVQKAVRLAYSSEFNGINLIHDAYDQGKKPDEVSEVVEVFYRAAVYKTTLTVLGSELKDHAFFDHLTVEDMLSAVKSFHEFLKAKFSQPSFVDQIPDHKLIRDWQRFTDSWILEAFIQAVQDNLTHDPELKSAAPVKVDNEPTKISILDELKRIALFRQAAVPQQFFIGGMISTICWDLCAAAVTWPNGEYLTQQVEKTDLDLYVASAVVRNLLMWINEDVEIPGLSHRHAKVLPGRQIKRKTIFVSNDFKIVQLKINVNEYIAKAVSGRIYEYMTLLYSLSIVTKSKMIEINPLYADFSYEKIVDRLGRHAFQVVEKDVIEMEHARDKELSSIEQPKK